MDLLHEESGARAAVNPLLLIIGECALIARSCVPKRVVLGRKRQSSHVPLLDG